MSSGGTQVLTVWSKSQFVTLPRCTYLTLAKMPNIHQHCEKSMVGGYFGGNCWLFCV